MIKISPIFCDHMILQRDVPVKIWGEADLPVTVSIDFNSSVCWSRDGAFEITLPPHKAGGPYTMFVECGGEVIKLHDIYYGDVYLAGGQSNMGLTLADAPQELDECALPVRIFTQERSWECDIRPETDMRWVNIAKENANGISAAASHFAIELANTQNVPIGIVSCNQGASCIRTWISPETVEADPFFATNPTFHDDATIFPFNGYSDQYLERLVKVAPYTVRGVIWYQGESDTADTIVEHYAYMFDLMVKDWRRLWGNDDLPFITVQLTYHTVDRPNDRWELMRDQQVKAALEGHNIGMITIGDAGDLPDIHPRDKKTVGLRLARYARGMIYGEDIVYKPPMCTGAVLDGDTVTLSFSDTGEGLYETEELTFLVADESGTDHKASYELCGDKVRVKADGIKPAAVKFCYDAESAVHLYSSADLPASPFKITL
ncbi:MAG: hypothetical protein IJ457_07680 [Clostridia bacterium]|nr:hypothetical protein [Clostridia bacterium]